MLSNKNHFIFIITILLSLQGIIKAHQCYVCGLNEILTCDNFDIKNETYIQECLPDYKGCSIQTYGNTIMVRSCERFALKDCKNANNVQYCYCSKKLCNGDYLTDDEDFIGEGSGITILTDKIDYSTNNTTTKENNSSQISNYLYYFVYIFCFII